VVSIGGRLGTLHEFTIAMEAGVPIGFLQGAGGISEEVKTLMTIAEPLPTDAEVLFNDSAEALIRDLTKHLDTVNAKYHNLYR
jgi:hypothetical protein